MSTTPDGIKAGLNSPPISSTDDRDSCLRGVIGALVVLLIIAAAEPLVFGSGAYVQLSVHPFWVVILIAAMQHGATVGVAAAVMASLLIGLPDRAVGEDATVFAARAAVLPLQWLVVALIVGLYRQQEISVTNDLRAQVAQAESAADSLAAEVERMDSMVVELERNAAGRPAPAVEGAASETSQEGSRLRRALPELAGLAGSQGTEIPEAFDAAIAALFDGPVVLALAEPGQGALVMGTPLDLDRSKPEDLIAQLLAAMQEGAESETVSLRDAGFEENELSKNGLAADSAARVFHMHARDKSGMTATVAYFAQTIADADASAERVELVSEMSRIAVDRLSRGLGPGKDSMAMSRSSA
jgi:hypothetical protein